MIQILGIILLAIGIASILYGIFNLELFPICMGIIALLLFFGLDIKNPKTQEHKITNVQEVHIDTVKVIQADTVLVTYNIRYIQ